MSAAESAERSGGGHVRILVGLAAGILLGLARSLQGPDGKRLSWCRQRCQLRNLWGGSFCV
jgi:hypothetical protein